MTGRRIVGAPRAGATKRVNGSRGFGASEGCPKGQQQG